MLKSRVLTALVLLAGFLAVFLWLAPTQFQLALVPVVAVAAWEWGRLCLPGRVVAAWIYAVLVAAVLLLMLLFEESFPGIAFSGALLWCLTPLLMAKWQGRRDVPRAALVIGILVLAPAFAAIVALRAATGGSGYLLWVMLLIVWSADIGAFFVGRRFGRRRLAPGISPGKTLEGAVGGMGLATVAGVAVVVLVPQPGIQPGLPWIGICLLTAAFSILGDLTESLVKRMAGVKDSGALLPGHGGVLDRIDGILAAAPVFATAVWALGLI